MSGKQIAAIAATVVAAAALGVGLDSCGSNPKPTPPGICNVTVDHDHDCAVEPDNDGNR